MMNYMNMKSILNWQKNYIILNLLGEHNMNNNYSMLFEHRKNFTSADIYFRSIRS